MREARGGDFRLELSVETQIDKETKVKKKRLYEIMTPPIQTHPSTGEPLIPNRHRH